MPLPTLDQAHPILAGRVKALADAHVAAHVDRTLRLVTTTRSIEDQHRAFLKGTSKIDGLTVFGLHNYAPSLAVDVHVIQMEKGWTAPVALVQGNMTVAKGRVIIRTEDKKFLDGLKTWDVYRAFGNTAEAFGLEWGGAWLNFRDGPHLQLPYVDRIKALQEALTRKGYEVAVDGKYGPKTAAAVEMASRKAGVSFVISSRQAKQFPCHPRTWAWLMAGEE